MRPIGIGALDGNGRLEVDLSWELVSLDKRKETLLVISPELDDNGLGLGFSMLVLEEKLSDKYLGGV